MTVVEWIAAALGVVCVALAVRRSLWNYPFAIASVALLGAVFWEARLYSEAVLQVFFVAINGYGWLAWTRSRETAGEVVVETMGLIEQVGMLSGMVGLTLGWGAIMASQTDAAYPFIDAAVAMLSVGAQVMLARRKLENWIVWIAVDAIAVPLYLSRGLYAVATLYAVYLVLSVWGLIDWRRRLVRRMGPVAA